MVISLKQAIDAWKAIERVQATKGSNKWAYWISKNKSKLKPEVDAVDASMGELIKADQARVAYCEKNCTRNEKGRPMLDAAGQFMGLDTKAPELVALVAEVKRLAEAHEEFIKTTTDIGITIIPFSEVPNDIAPIDFEGLQIMIGEPK